MPARHHNCALNRRVSPRQYGLPSEMAAQIAKARDWLLAAKPVSSEQRNMRLLGLYWAGADAATLKPLVAEILAAQQRDGGWRQIDTLAPDAYATGQSLYALAKAGVSPADPAYQRGVAYLLATQAENGSWRVERDSWGMGLASGIVAGGGLDPDPRTADSPVTRSDQGPPTDGTGPHQRPVSRCALAPASWRGRRLRGRAAWRRLTGAPSLPMWHAPDD